MANTFWNKLPFGKNRKNKLRAKWTAGNIIFIGVAILLAVYALFLLILLCWGFLTSMKDFYRDFARGNVAGFPNPWTFQNYATALESFFVDITVSSGTYRINLLGLFEYTILYAVGCAFFATLSPCIVAYTVARFGRKFKFLNVYTSIVIVCLVLPIVGNTPSEIRIARALGLYDQIWGMWILKAHFLCMYYLVFFGTYRAMPDGFAEAAKIDGAGNCRIFFQIYFPLTRNLFTTVMLIQVIALWNDYQTPLLYLDSWPTLAYWLFMYNQQTGDDVSVMTLRATGIMLLLLPLLIAFLFFSKRIMGNLSLGGLKE